MEPEILAPYCLSPPPAAQGPWATSFNDLSPLLISIGGGGLNEVMQNEWFTQ